jgi:predicted ATPase
LGIANGIEHGGDGRFDTRLIRLKNAKPQIFDRFESWFPEDLLRVKYSSITTNPKFNNLENGSDGQKAAAILAFLLSYGNEPLVIDQPEDDLDNTLIYDLIVKQIHENKSRRQLIIATHNPNIVVNGDAELVHVLKFAKGQIQLDQQGGFEEKSIRDAICMIMEGGRKAFDDRYKRITLEVNHA